MNYYKYTFTVTPPEPGTDILIACLAEMDFESFESNDNGFVAYIPETLNSNVNFTELVFEDFKFEYSFQKIEQVNWNEEWEKNFSPVIINKDCIIRAPFHKSDHPYKYDLVIMPKMSFGTGHHDTTSLMCKNMLETDFNNKTVLDAGTGTGVLAILAEKLGAKHIYANDIDEWSVLNAIENCEVNHCKNIKVFQGDATLFEEKNKYDVILANINKNVLKSYIPKIASVLKQEGLLFLSGFFKTDTDELIHLASEHSIVLYKVELKNEWAVIVLKKTK